MTQLTIFGIPRAFEGLHYLWQRNAIMSWLRIEPKPQVILIGDDAGVAAFASKHGCEHARKIAKNEWGTPLVGAAFRKARDLGMGALKCYSNCDIIYTGGLAEAAQACADEFPGPFLMTGRRWDGDLREAVDFENPKWKHKIWARMTKKGHYHSPRGADYFVYRPGTYGDIPGFAVGRSAWDNWLVLDATRREIPTIDATPIVRALHQGKSKRTPTPKREWRRNQAVWFASGGVRDGGYVNSAEWILRPEGFAKREQRARWR